MFNIQFCRSQTEDILIGVSHSGMVEDSNILVNIAVPVGVLLLTFRFFVRISHLHTRSNIPEDLNLGILR